MDSVKEVIDETSELLGAAVAEVSRRAIEPHLEPFKTQLERLQSNLFKHVEEIGGLAQDERRFLERTNKHLDTLSSVAKCQSESLAEALEQFVKLRESLDALGEELAQSRHALGAVGELLQATQAQAHDWTRLAFDQSRTLAAILESEHGLLSRFEEQASGFSRTADALHARLGVASAEMHELVVSVRAEFATTATYTREWLEKEFVAARHTSRRTLWLLLGNLGLGLLASIMASLAVWMAHH